jgi:hypothetical protein
VACVTDAARRAAARAVVWWLALALALANSIIDEITIGVPAGREYWRVGAFCACRA